MTYSIEQVSEMLNISISTLGKRYELFIWQKEITEQQIALLQKSLELINDKCEYYRITKEAGTTDIPGSKDSLASRFSQEIDKIPGDFFSSWYKYLFITYTFHL